ncbi:MAG: outer membrane lipoprotein-sorting protein [Verrucomicrobia bacterium]|nr:MAG: outer membrane lipoprotein-sorting protein [Verrucomicrobiota bacterium]
MLKRFLKFLAAGLLFFSVANAQDPAAILAGARISATLVQLDPANPLSGKLSHDGKKTELALFLNGKNIQFQFRQGAAAWEIFHMRLADDQYDLFEMVGGKTRNFPANRLVEPIAATDLTYEDLALRFFYWPNPKLEGQEDVNGQPCYKLRINKPKGTAGKYETVYVWVHTKFGAFMKIRGHAKNGGLVKEFQVQDIMQVANNVWTLKKMQVATHDPANDRRLSITSVTFDAPKKSALKGLR